MPSTFEALAIALLAIVPGYIAVTLWARTKTWERPATDLKLVLQAIIVSALIQVLLAPLTILLIWPVRDNLADHPWRVFFWAFATVIVLPAVGGYVVGRLSDLFSGALRIPVPSLGLSGPVDWAGWKSVLVPTSDDLGPIAPSPWDRFIRSGIADGQFLIVTFDDN